ncbi:hypothetical protein H3H37_03770 [Duganella sp. LX20W]|uniref:Uncharacterized protein n=1 Tax=Rugamonas brunnea TaxID=2758569 RepID=A0A7W2IAS2_9BURK|nr:hypothetical protein [Rugamonas brunnea]MBA5636162.1 hypothetical protein [Rugamonas brunnea]
MGNKNLQQAIEDKCLKALKNTAPLSLPKLQQLSPTEAMFVLAVDGMTGSPMAALNEESLTANFAGRLAAQYTWAVECIGNKGGQAALWGEYSKNGQGYDSESKRGADFALVVPISKKEVRVAIFQAKKARGEQANIGQSGSPTAPEAQWEKLLDTAGTIAHAAGIPEEESLKWTHYVFWRETGKFPKSISLAHLKAILGDDESKKVDTSADTFGSFADLLLAAKAKGDIKQGKFAVVAGWLQLGAKEAKDFLPKLNALTDVIFADEEGQGGAFEAFLAIANQQHSLTEIEPVDRLSVAEHEAGTDAPAHHKKKKM